MILNKKGLAVLPLAALLFTSCAKNVSYEDACKFVRENYTSKEEKTPTSGYLEIKGAGNNEETREMIKAYAASLGFELDDNLYKKQNLEKEQLEKLTAAPLVEEEIMHALDGETGTDYTYTINGKKFTQGYHGKDEQGEFWFSTDYNDNGYITKAYSKITMSMDSNTATLEQSTNLAY